MTSLIPYHVDIHIIYKGNLFTQKINGVLHQTADSFNLESQCGLCESPPQNPNAIRFECGHEFHVECIVPWVSKAPDMKSPNPRVHNMCPTCGRMIVRHNCTCGCTKDEFRPLQKKLKFISKGDS